MPNRENRTRKIQHPVKAIFLDFFFLNKRSTRREEMWGKCAKKMSGDWGQAEFIKIRGNWGWLAGRYSWMVLGHGLVRVRGCFWVVWCGRRLGFVWELNFSFYFLYIFYFKFLFFINLYCNPTGLTRIYSDPIPIWSDCSNIVWSDHMLYQNLIRCPPPSCANDET